MPVTMSCPSCEREFANIPDAIVGKMIRCKECQTTFLVAVPDSGLMPLPTAAVGEAPPFAALLPGVKLPKLAAILTDKAATPADVRILEDEDDDDDDDDDVEPNPVRSRSKRLPNNDDDEDDDADRPIRRRQPKRKSALPLVASAVAGVIALGGVAFGVYTVLNKQAENETASNTNAQNAAAQIQTPALVTPPDRTGWQPSSVVPQQELPPKAAEQARAKDKEQPKPKLSEPGEANPFNPKPKANPTVVSPPVMAAPQPPRNTPLKDKVDEATLMRVKASTVYIEVDNGRGGGGTGTGWFAFEPGLIVTNAHVVGMKLRGSKEPLKISVFLDSGTDKQQLIEGPSIKVLGVDHDNDVAILQIVNSGNALPVPLTMRPSSQLRDLDKLLVLGFPGGRRISERNGSTKAPVISTTTTEVSAFRNDDFGQRRVIQLQGGVNHGSSGGPLIDMDGNVVGVPVRVDHNHEGNLTTIAEALPSETIQSLGEGRPTRMDVGQPYLQGNAVAFPITVKCLDPRKKLTALSVGTWVGNKNPTSRAPGEKYVEQPGDIAYVEVALTLNRDTGIATGELSYTKDTDGRVYWMQPITASSIAPRRFLKAEVLPINDRPPVERATLPLEARYEFGKHAFTVAVATTYTDVSTVQEKDVREKRSFTHEVRYSETIAKPKVPADTASLEYVPNRLDVKFTRGDETPELSKPLLDMQEIVKSQTMTINVKRNGEARSFSSGFAGQTDPGKRDQLKALNGVLLQELQQSLVMLTGKSTAALSAWEINRTHTFLLEPDDFIPGVGGTKRKDTAVREKWTVAYLGRRDRGGRSELVLSIDGVIQPAVEQQKAIGGTTKGTLILDENTCAMVKLEIAREFDVEYTVEGAKKRAVGTEQTIITRE